MFDILQVIFWSITYLLIIIASYSKFKNKKLAIPIIASTLNFTWEIVALIHCNFHWIHIIWTSLDIFIIIYNCIFLKKIKYISFYVVIIFIISIIISYIFIFKNGMLYSCFVIDLLMALNFLISRKKLSNIMIIPIGITKFIGDLFAFIHYSHVSLVMILGIIVLVINVIYCTLVILDYKVIKIIE